MSLQQIQIHASPKQLSKLRNGHAVNVKRPMDGAGFSLLVDPAKYNLMSRTFEGGKGLRISLAPNEIQASSQIQGSGIKATRKPKTEITKVAQEYLSHPEKFVGVRNNVGGPHATLTPTSIFGAIEQVKLLDELNERLGTKYGATTKASIANALAGVSQASADTTMIDASKDAQLMGQGLYLGRGGRGRHPSMEGGSIGRGAGMIHANPQALQSQPYSSNFQFSKTLPVSYQRFSQGQGLGAGLYI